MLTERPVVARTRLSLGAVVDRVLAAIRVERRLADVKVSVSRGDGGMTIRGSEPLLVMALGGMLQAMVALVSEVPPGALRLSVGVQASSAILELSQWTAAVPGVMLARFFDDQYLDRPGGYASAVALAATKRVIELHNGQATVERGERDGCRLTLVIPV